MKMRVTFKRLAPAVLVMLLLAACANNAPPPEATPAPGLEAASPMAEPPTPTRRPLPPTWTPVGSSGQPEPQAQPVQGAQDTAPAVTAVPGTPRTTPTTPPECLIFRADYERTGDTFPLGTSPTIYWTLIPRATYRVEILDSQENVVYSTTLPSGTNSASIPAETFQVDERILAAGTLIVYTWRLTPMDEAGNQQCYSPGGELIPVLGAGQSGGGS